LALPEALHCRTTHGPLDISLPSSCMPSTTFDHQDSIVVAARSRTGALDITTLSYQRWREAIRDILCWRSTAANILMLPMSSFTRLHSSDPTQSTLNTTTSTAQALSMSIKIQQEHLIRDVSSTSSFSSYSAPPPVRPPILSSLSLFAIILARSFDVVPPPLPRKPTSRGSINT
jgi:hypothetical protein